MEGIHHHQGAGRAATAERKDHHHSQHLGDLPGETGKQETRGAKGESWLPGLSVTHKCPGLANL